MNNAQIKAIRDMAANNTTANKTPAGYEVRHMGRLLGIVQNWESVKELLSYEIASR